MTQESVAKEGPEASAPVHAAADATPSTPLRERFRILRQLPGGPQRRQYLAEDKQEKRYVLLAIAKWEQETELEREFEISQQLHSTHQSRHIVKCHALYQGKAAVDALASLPGDEFNQLSQSHCTEFVLVSEFLSAIGRPEQPAETLQYVRRLLHVERASLPSGEPLRSAPQAAFLYELMGRELIATLEELARAQVIHADLQPQKLALCIDPSALLMGFQEGQQQTFIKAMDLSTALQEEALVQVSRRDLPYQSPQRLKALLGGSQEPHKASLADDVFSMGAILYTLLTGEPPYTTSNELPWFDRARALHEQWTKSQAPPALSHDWIERDILDAIQAMCAFDAADRPDAATLMSTFSRPWSKTARRFSNQLFAPPASTLHEWLGQLQTLPSLLQELKKETLQPFPTLLQSLPEWLRLATEALEDIVTEQTEVQEQQAEALKAQQAQIVEQASQLNALRAERDAEEEGVGPRLPDDDPRLKQIRQEAFEEAYQEAYQKAQQESMQRADDLLMIRAHPSHPLQTQNVMPTEFDPAQVDALQESVLQLKQEYTQLNAVFQMEQEQTQMAIEALLDSLEERDAAEREELETMQRELDATRLELNQRLQALQAEEEVLQSSLTQLQQRLGLREAIKQGELSQPPPHRGRDEEQTNTDDAAVVIGTIAEQEPLPEDPMDGFAPPFERPMPQMPVHTDLSIAATPGEPGQPIMPVYRSQPAKLKRPPSKLMTTAPLDLLDEAESNEFVGFEGFDEDDDDVQVIVGTPAEPSKMELPGHLPPAPRTPLPPGVSPLGNRVLQEPTIGQLHSALQNDLQTFFTRLEQIPWFSGEGAPDHVYNLMQQHIRRLTPFATSQGKPKPKLLAMFRSGTHHMHRLMASSELLNARVEKVFEASLSSQPDNWSGAGQAVWSCLRDINIDEQTSAGGSRFGADHWMVPWDLACDTILETTWIAANDVAWSVARDAPRFAASDTAADAANELQRAPARSALWSITWEFVRFAASGTLWSASSNAASDIANDVAWRLVQDQMAERNFLNPFSPLFRVWAAGWWPIHLASGDTILWAPLPDPSALEVIWEVERGDYRP